MKNNCFIVFRLKLKVYMLGSNNNINAGIKNIIRIGTHPLGIGLYEYDLFGEREMGVMADEVMMVMPEAVMRHPTGFLMVDYGRLYGRLHA